MAINFRSNTIIRNLSIGPLSGGGNGGGSSFGTTQPSYLAAQSGQHNNSSHPYEVYVYDASNYSASPTKITEFPGASSSTYGAGLAVSSNYVAVGARLVSGGGRAYVYSTSNLSNSPTVLTSPDAAQGEQFGHNLTILDDTLVVGAPADDIVKGASYVYSLSNLSASPVKLTAPNRTSTDYFGSRAAISDTYIAISSPGANSYLGEVYVYDKLNLSSTPTKLTAPDGVAGDDFGRFIGFTNSNLVIGASNDDNNTGAVYVYNSSDLSTTPTKLTAFDGETGDYFGRITTTGDYLVVSAPYDDDVNNNSGGVYVYDTNNLSSTPTKLTPSDGDENGYFGTSIAAFGTQLAVGAHTSTSVSFNQGLIYLYDMTDLSVSPTVITASDSISNDKFGQTVALG